MKVNRFLVIVLILIVLFLSLGVATADDSPAITVINGDIEQSSSDSNENYNARIITENITQTYEYYNEISVRVVDNNNNSIDGAMVYADNDDVMFPEDYGGKYYFVHYLDAGTYNLKFTLDDGIYKAEPAYMTLKILPTTFYGKITCKAYYGTTKDTLTMKATVYDDFNDFYEDGYVTFKVNGKSYTVKTKNGVATKKLKLKSWSLYIYCEIYQ